MTAPLTVLTLADALMRASVVAQEWRHPDDDRNRSALTKDERAGVYDDIEQWFGEQPQPMPLSRRPELDAEIEARCLFRCEGREPDTRERGDDDGQEYGDPGAKMRGEE